MSRGGTASKTAPVGWVFLNPQRQEGITVRWRRGDPEAHVLRGKQVGSWTMEGLLGKIPVSPRGWADLAEVRQTGERWVRAK